MADVDVDGTDVDGVTIALRSGATLTGRVVHEEGETISGQLRVQLVPDESDTQVSYTQPASVGDDGTFTIENVFGRRYVRLLTTGAAAMPT